MPIYVCPYCNKKISEHDSYSMIDDLRFHANCALAKYAEEPVKNITPEDRMLEILSEIKKNTARQANDIDSIKSIIIILLVFIFIAVIFQGCSTFI